MRKRLRLPFLHQLLLTYLVALLLPVALIGRQTWVGYQRTLENEIRQTNSQLLTEIASVINMQLQGLEQIAVNLDLNEDLRPFAVTSTPYGAVQALQTLSQYRSSNSFIYEVGYYIRGNPYLYTSTAAYPLSQFLDHFFAQDGLDDSKLQDLLETCRAPVILPAAPTTFVLSDIRLMTFIYPLPVAGEPYATAVFFVEEARLSSLLTSIFSRSNEQTYLLDKQDQVLVALGEPDTKMALGPILDQLRSDLKDGQKTVVSQVMDIGQTRMIVTYQDGGYRGLQVLSLSPLSEIMAPALYQQRRFFITLAVVALAGLTVVALSLLVTYKPLGRLFRKVRAIQDHPVIMNNEIALISQMLDQMQLENQQLKIVQQETKSDVRLAFLTDLISGLVDEDQFAQRQESADIHLSGAACAALAVLLEEDRAPDDLLQLIPSGLIRLPDGQLHILRPLGDRVIPVVAVLEQTDRAWYDRCVSHLFLLAQENGLEITVGAGNPVQQALQLVQSWSQAGEALSYRFITGKGSLIHYADKAGQQQLLPWYPHREIEDLINGITSGQSGLIHTAVASVLEQIRQKNLGIFAARCLCYDLINTVLRVVVSQNVRPDVLENQLADIIRLPQTETIQKLGDYLISFCVTLSERLGKTRDSRLDKVMAYLDSHARDSSFSVYSMAADLGMSYSYLNRIFSSQTGQTVLDYLTDRRMDWVKKQLAETSQPIKDIIMAAGYNDIPNFSRKFKQREGISPRQFRDQYRSGGEPDRT